MDKESRNWFEILMSHVEALTVRIRKLEEADPGRWLEGLDRRVGALEAASGLAQRPDAELVIRVVHVPGDDGGG